MSKSSFTRKYDDKKYDAIWFALDEGSHITTTHKKQFKVKFEKRLNLEAQDQVQEVHRQLFLHRLNRIRPDVVTFKEPNFFCWDHTRRELESINVFFLRKLPDGAYRYEKSIDVHDERHNRKLKTAVIEKFPAVDQFVPFYDIIQVFNRDGIVKYFLAQNGRPLTVPNKALMKPPFGNAEYFPDQNGQSNVVNYFLVTMNSEMAIKIICNDLSTASLASVHIGRHRIGRIHLTQFGELVLVNETIPPDEDTEGYIVKGQHFPKQKQYVFTVSKVTGSGRVIANITCKFWKNLTAKNMNRTRMFGIFFKSKVNIIVKALILGAAFIIVHDFYRIYWNGNVHKKKKPTIICKMKRKDASKNDVDAEPPLFDCTVPKMAPSFLTNNKLMKKE